MCTSCMQYPWRPEEGNRFTEPELMAFVSLLVGSGNLTQVSLKSSMYFEMLSQTSSSQKKNFTMVNYKRAHYNN